MLGFDYVVISESGQGMARWSEGVQSPHWLDELVTRGLATYVDGNGWPNVYTLKATDLRPHLVRLGRFVHCLEADFESSTGEEVLTVEAWDAG